MLLPVEWLGERIGSEEEEDRVQGENKWREKGDCTALHSAQRDDVDIGTRPGRKLARYDMFCEQILTSGFISSLEPEEWPSSNSDIPFVALL